MDGFGCTTTDLLRDLGGFVEAVQAGQQDQHLVTSGAPDGVAVADTLADPVCHGREHDIADTVAPRVVDGFETIDIAEQHAKFRSGSSGVPQRGLKAPDCLGPVDQPGQCIDSGQPFKLLLRLDLVIDDVQCRDHSIGVARGVDPVLCVDVDPVIVAVDGGDPTPCMSRSVVTDLRHRGLHCAEVIRMDEAA